MQFFTALYVISNNSISKTLQPECCNDVLKILHLLEYYLLTCHIEFIVT